MGEPGKPSAKKVKNQIPEGSQTIFHIVAEDVERPHVAEEMQKTPVEEHERDKGQDLLKGREMKGYLRDGVAGRNKAVSEDKLLYPGPLQALNDKQEQVDTYQEVVHHRMVLGLIGVANRNHFSTP
jgi:hypothetical protein